VVTRPVVRVKAAVKAQVMAWRARALAMVQVVSLAVAAD
jgi:hypothetical protein